MIKLGLWTNVKYIFVMFYVVIFKKSAKINLCDIANVH